MLNCLAKEEEAESREIKSKTLITSFLPRQLLLNNSNSKQTNIINSSITSNSQSSQQTQTPTPLLVNSISRFLANNGFSKTLKYFLKEAHFQKDGGQNCSIDIEDMCFHYLKSRNSAKEEQGTNQKNFEKIKEIEDNEGMRVEPTIENVTVVSVDVKSKKKKKKKKKRKNANGAYEQAIEETLTKTSEHPEEIPSSLPIEPTKISNDKKKKKHEDASEHLDKDVQDKQSEVVKKNVERKKKKEKKVKKAKDGIKMEENVNVYTNQSNGTIESSEEKKESMKRKKQSAEGSGADHVEEATFDDSKRRKTDGSDISNKIAQPPKSPNRPANRVLENDGMEKSHKQHKTKELNGSAEPRTAKAFQRVKPEDVEFADERLQDNSYWAKDGADSGYGAKAQEVLGEVRGRDFRHEKTKKKRGSYRGGQIDLHTHSVKFNYEDDDE